MTCLSVERSDSTIIIDDEDFSRLVKYKFYEFYRRGHLCIYANVNSKKKAIQNIIMGEPPENLTWDHKDRNTLNNQKDNFRLANKNQQMANRDKFIGLQCARSSQFKGVDFRSREKKWRTRIQVNKKMMELGYSNTEIEAAQKYNEAALKHFGEFAVLNEV